MINYHLALFTPGYIELILSGKKNIESRFSKIKCPPYRKIKDGDIVYMKEVKGLIKGIFSVDAVETYDNLSAKDIDKIDWSYRKHIFGTLDSESHLERWNKCRYATLIHIGKRIQVVKPAHFKNKSRNGWIVLDEKLLLDKNMDRVYDLRG